MYILVAVDSNFLVEERVNNIKIISQAIKTVFV